MPDGPRPLEGLTVVITGSRRAVEQSALVSKLGGTPYTVPTVGIGLSADDSEVEPFLKTLTANGGVDYAVFMTGPGVRAMVDAAERMGLEVTDSLNSPRTTVIARSGKVRIELAKLGIKVDASPPGGKEATTDGVVRLLREKGLRGKKVAILWHGSRNGSVRGELEASGALDVFECSTYHYSTTLEAGGARVLGEMGFRYKPPEEEAVLKLIRELLNEKERRLDAITFTSPPAVANLFEIAAKNGLEESLADALRKQDGIAIAAVGPSTRRELEAEHWIKVHVVPEVPGMGAMLNALADYLRTRPEGRDSRC